MINHRNRYLEVLGLRPGTSLDEINTTYFTIVKKFPQNPTDEDETRMQELKRAYDMLRRAYGPVSDKGLKILFGRRLVLLVLGALSIVAFVALVALNYGTIRLKFTRYDNGVVLRLRMQSEPYGEIVGFDSTHRFASGNPSAAYAIRLTGREDTVWVNERLVVNGMTPVSGSK